MTLSDSLVSDLALKRGVAPRLKNYEERSFAHREVAEAEAKGWVAEVTRKTVVVMRRNKTHDELFEDRVWATMALLGFKRMNAHRNVVLHYGSGSSDRKQVDVLAIDDEVALVVECKSSAADRAPTASLKDEIELLRSYQQGFRAQLRREFPGIKVKFLLATNNLQPSREADERLQSADIKHLSDDDITYYLSLAQQLGPAAKHQLLGDMFSGTKIPNLDLQIPAVEGRMGGKRYYSFLIEPAKLLQIAFVLHHRRGERTSYQRVIKRTRLRKVAGFIEGGGMFPSSIVVNLEAGGRGLRFDRVQSNAEGGGRIGVLHLPQKYRSAFVIDGQHRLYGYAESTVASSELVPVVAFVDLPPTEQVELFMEINENQQPVPKNLRTALNADLLWHSDSLVDRANALRSRLAQDLADDRKSPLFGRVISGEDSSGARTITLASLTRGIDNGHFIGKFTTTQQKSQGTFFRVGNEQTYAPLRAFLFSVLHDVRERTPSQWDRAAGGLIYNNPGMVALLTLIGEVVLHTTAKGSSNPVNDGADAVRRDIEPYLDAFCQAVESMSPESYVELKSAYGSTGPQKYLRLFQSLVNEAHADFAPLGFAEWKDAQSQDNKVAAFELSTAIEDFLNRDVRHRLEAAFGADWRKVGVPDDVYREANKVAVERQIEAGSETPFDWWKALYLVHYDKIIRKSQANFEAAFGDAYTPPSARGVKKGSWRDRVSWLSRLNEIRNANAHGRGASSDDVTFLQDLHRWLTSID